MFEEMAAEEIVALGFGVIIILMGVYRIITSGKHGSNFFNWVLVLSTGACLYLWQSGLAMEWYLYIKEVLITPDF